MITIFTRPTCAQCPSVKKYLQMKNVEFEEKLAEGSEYEKYAQMFGFSVPLTINGDQAVIGINYPRLAELIAS